MDHTGITGLKKDWVPTESAFRRFLQWLDQGSDSNGERYLQMRDRLVRYFDRKRCIPADDLADETLNRAARRLDELGAITDANPAQYCFTIAKFVLLEYFRQPRPQGVEDESAFGSIAVIRAAHPPPDESEETEKQLACLERCLTKLLPENRHLILEYYRGEQQEKIRRRRELAETLALTVNALSIRACRIRAQLETCVSRCSKES